MNPSAVNVEVHYRDADNTGDNIMEPFREATVNDVWKKINDFMGVEKEDVNVKTCEGVLLPDDGNIFLKDIIGNKETLRLDVSYAKADELLGGKKTEDRKFKLELAEPDAATLNWTRKLLIGPETNFKTIEIQGTDKLGLPIKGFFKKEASFAILCDIEKEGKDTEFKVKRFNLQKKGQVKIVKLESSPDNGLMKTTDKIFLDEEDITEEGVTDKYYEKNDRAKKTLADDHKEYELKTGRIRARGAPLEAGLGGAVEGAIGGLGGLI